MRSTAFGCALSVNAPPWLDSCDEKRFQHVENVSDIKYAKYLQLAAENSARRFGPRHAAGILEHALELVGTLPITQRAELELAILERSGAICTASLDSRAVDTGAAATAASTCP